jgi:RND family efflux transporter MFP subunit
LVILGFGAWGLKHWVWTSSREGEDVLAVVTRLDLPIVVTERGNLESAQTVIAKCEIEGKTGSKIVFLLPEGGRVKKGEVVVRFDADELRRAMAEQEIKFKTADAKAKAAKEELDVQKNKAESEIAKADLALTLAVLDHEKYLDGEYKVEVDDKKGAINLAERELKEAEEKLEGFRIFVKKGFGTPEQLSLKELEVARAKNNLERDRAKLMVLEKFTRHRQEAELTAKAEEAKRELKRTRSSSRATVAKAEADLDSALVVADLEKEQLDRARKQLDHAELKAPEDGIVVYAQSRFWDPNTRIQLGGVVSYQQPIFHLPELEHMQVKVKIHEAKIKKIQVGQKAEIRVEAFSGLLLHGTVASVATLASSEVPWMSGGVKEYETIVKVDDLPTGAGLKPGFSAAVSISVNRLPNVLAVPLQAVTQRGDKYFAYVSTAHGVERREITVGENNERFVEVREGLDEGESVVLDARARSAAEAQASDGEEKSPQPDKPPEKPVPPPGPALP